MQLRSYRYLGTLSPILTQEANLEDLIVKMLNIGQMKQETTWKLSQMNSTLGCPGNGFHDGYDAFANQQSYKLSYLWQINSRNKEHHSSVNGDTEASSSPNSQENRKTTTGWERKLQRRILRSTGDLRDSENLGPFMVTGATDTQRQIPEFFTGRIHSHPNLERQESTTITLRALLCQPQSLRCMKHPRTH